MFKVTIYYQSNIEVPNWNLKFMHSNLKSQIVTSKIQTYLSFGPLFSNPPGVLGNDLALWFARYDGFKLSRLNIHCPPLFFQVLEKVMMDCQNFFFLRVQEFLDNRPLNLQTGKHC
jgi:hypothetical protein